MGVYTERERAESEISVSLEGVENCDAVRFSLPQSSLRGTSFARTPRFAPLASLVHVIHHGENDCSFGIFRSFIAHQIRPLQ
jgi:hypothetical protein